MKERESEKRDDEIKNQSCWTTGVRHLKSWREKDKWGRIYSKERNFKQKCGKEQKKVH